ncbi:hypothetical protein NDU88_008854 [Pleurodeles waltl]|uniref:Uncharacterized protein n=1 Tax=Pleurodeles waltl TaxID=8319 RepID=A0AAV7QTQ9_PLEWA|nr:hypothetical protein NDU88_008854 [Pleurodeles waltl]
MWVRPHHAIPAADAGHRYIGDEVRPRSIMWMTHHRPSISTGAPLNKSGVLGPVPCPHPQCGEKNVRVSVHNLRLRRNFLQAELLISPEAV